MLDVEVVDDATSTTAGGVELVPSCAMAFDDQVMVAGLVKVPSTSNSPST